MTPMRVTLPAIALLALAGCGGADGVTAPTRAQGERFSATLTGASVVPANASGSTGSISFQAANDSTLAFSLSVSNMSGITQAHLHTAAAGVNGATLVWLLPVNGTAAQPASVELSGVIAIGDVDPTWVRGTPRLAMDSVKTLMRAGRLYVDVHSSTFVNGEIRGQVAKLP